MTKQYRGGAYSFRDSLVMGRVTGIAGRDVTILVKSAYYPVVLTVTGEATTETWDASGSKTVTMPDDGTFVCVLQEGVVAGVNPRTDSDSFSVTVAE